MATKLRWPISVGIWFVESPGGDRFTKQYKPGLSILERIELIGKMRGVKGFEAHYPYEINEDNFEEVRRAARDNGLKILTISPGLFVEMEFKNGALTSSDPKVRKKAVERMRTAIQMCEELNRAGEGGEFLIYWPASDGVTYPFEAYHPDKRKWMMEGLLQVLDGTTRPIAIEHKPSDPAAKTYSGTTGEAILLCKELQAQLPEDEKHRVGINPEMAHLLMANANLGADVSLILEHGLLRHTHWNTCPRLGADLDMMVGSDNWWQTAEVFFWLEEYDYKYWLGLDLLPKNEDTVRAVDVTITAMEIMYAQVMAVRDVLRENMKAGREATYNLMELFKTMKVEYEPLE